MLGVFAIIFGVIGLLVMASIFFVKKRPDQPDLQSDRYQTIGNEYDRRDTFNRDYQRWERYDSPRPWIIAIGGGVVGGALVLLAFGLFTKVDAGEVLVPVQFGEVLDSIEVEGISMISPFATRVRMPIRTVELSFLKPDPTEGQGEGEGDGLGSIGALSSEGAQVDVDVTVLYHIDPSLAGEVYRTIGTRWEEVLVIPWTRNTLRDCIPQYSFEEARTSLRGEASACILNAMQDALAHRGIVIENVLLREMRADAQLQAAIDAKLEAQSSAQRAEFEKREAIVRAQTVVINAEAQASATIAIANGEAQANDLIALSLTEELLQLRIYEQLNDKTVVIVGEGGQAPLPILPIGDQ